ncbi:MAG: hypothetical protein ICV61_19025 [Microcoleus sp. Co-bin12]|nr:hypothetical protein [Microcoleus sp. Co-bin12]
MRPNTVPDGLLRLITLMFPPKSLAINAGFWLKNPVSQPKSVISAMSHIHPDNLTMQRLCSEVGMNGGPVEL